MDPQTPPRTPPARRVGDPDGRRRPTRPSRRRVTRAPPRRSRRLTATVLVVAIALIGVRSSGSA